MSWNGKNGRLELLEERGFELEVAGRKVPGVHWQPEQGADRLVLLGHGGGTHKKTDYLLNVAKLLGAKGIASMAIDGPGHGDRLLAPGAPATAEFAEKWHAGGGNAGMLEDWRGALDFIEAEQGACPTGWWGLSMGTMMGLPVTATDSRIRVALLGLMGNWGPNAEALEELAPQVSCPVRFLVQWDDEVVPRDACLRLYGLFGFQKKTLHANPGAHAAVPSFEVAASVDYLDRHLK